MGSELQLPGDEDLSAAGTAWAGTVWTGTAQGEGSSGIGPPAADASADYLRLAAAQLDSTYRMAGYLLGDEVQAEEAVRVGLARAWEYWPELIDQARFPIWFDGIVLDVCRGRMHHPRVAVVSEEKPRSDAYREVAGGDGLARIVSHLCPEHRVVIALRYWLNLTPGEIADRMGSTAASVEKRLDEALATLERRQALEAAKAVAAGEVVPGSPGAPLPAVPAAPETPETSPKPKRRARSTQDDPAGREAH